MTALLAWPVSGPPGTAAGLGGWNEAAPQPQCQPGALGRPATMDATNHAGHGAGRARAKRGCSTARDRPGGTREARRTTLDTSVSSVVRSLGQVSELGRSGIGISR